jgi:hypothetical protein
MKLTHFTYLVLIASVMACSPQKRLRKLLDKNPELVQQDTIVVHDTIIVPEVKTDTVLTLEMMTDTVLIEKDNLQIKTIYRDNQVFIEGKCKSDTIYTETFVPVEKVIYVQDTIWTDIKKKFKRYWWWLLVLTTVFVAYRVAKRFI